MHFDNLSTISTLSRAAGVQIRRRQLLALLIAAPWIPAFAQTAGSAASAAGDKFMTLSKFATGRSKLDPDVAAQLLAALRESEDTFAVAVDQLAADASSGKYPDIERMEAAVRSTPNHAALLALLSAWYTGTVSVKGKPRFITLTGALLYEPIADGSHIPGQCAGATDSWANQPAPALAAMPSSESPTLGIPRWQLQIQLMWWWLAPAYAGRWSRTRQRRRDCRS